MEQFSRTALIIAAFATRSDMHRILPTKGELGAAVLQRYTANLAEYLDGLLTKGLDQDVCLKKYTDVFRTTLRNGNRMCLGGMLAAEHKELPAEVQAEVINFAEMNIRWLVRVLFLDKKVRLGVEAIQSRARAIYAAILGAQLAGRSRDDASIYDEIVKTYRTAGLIP